ncbi:MAG: AI-2E family transporter [Planctomycetota bacterium]
MANASRSDRPIAERHLWQFQAVRDVIVVLVVLLLIYLGYTISLVTVPLLAAMLLAYLFEPLVRTMVSKRGGMSREGAASLLILGIVSLVVVPVTIGTSYATVEGYRLTLRAFDRATEVTAFVGGYEKPQPVEAIEPAPTSAERDGAEGVVLSTEVPFADTIALQPQRVQEAWINLGGTRDRQGMFARLAQVLVQYEVFTLESEQLRALQSTLTSNAERLTKITVGTGVDAVAALLGGITAIGLLGFQLFLTMFFFFFMCTNYPRLIGTLDEMIPKKERDPVVAIIKKMDAAVSGFVRGRLVIAVLQSIAFIIAYSLAGVPGAFVLGIISGFLSIVPYAAMITIPIAIVLMYLDPPGGFRGAWWWMTIAPFLIYFLVQALDDYLLTPYIQGKNTGLDTPTVLFATLAGGVLLGVYGLLLAIPLAACIKILVIDVFLPRYRMWAAGEARDPLPLSSKD